MDTTQIVVSRSFDAGATYTSVSPEGARGIIDPTTYPSVAGSNQIGNIAVDYSQPVAGATYPNGEQVHTLYAIFAGPRDPGDNAQAQLPGNTSSGFNHIDTIYMAKSVDGGVTWADTEVYSTPPDSTRELNILFPVVAVDSAGIVYALWGDQLHVQYAFSTDHGQTWSKPHQVNPDNRGAQPDAGLADVMPWMAAGGPGKIDVVWYHGEGGAADSNVVHRDPGDSKTQWTVAFAQLFGANRAGSDGVPTPSLKAQSNDISGLIHTGDICQNGLSCDIFGGDRTLLDFFQVSLDNAGRANVAYASDQGSPGNSTIMYVRQNGGLSATTGKLLRKVNIVPLQLHNGTSCPGPQVTDAYGDAHSNILVGTASQGGNLDTYDIGAVRFTTPDADHIRVTLTIKDLSSIPVAPTTSTLWAVFWQFGDKTYFVRVTSNGPALQFFSDGFYTDNFHVTGSPDGQFNEGPNGTIVWTVPRTDVGSPLNGAILTSAHAEDHGAFTAADNGLRFVAFVDRAPDVESGAPYTLGGAC